MRFLPYLHPLWQVASLGVALWTLSLGLRMRARRRSRGRRRAGARSSLVRTHVRAGVGFLCAISVGYAAGPLTLVFVRGEDAFETGHAYFATVTILLLFLGGGVGWRLNAGAGERRDLDLHAFCMGAGLFLSFVTAMLGLGLLP